jgi:hypothetical protein
MPNRRPVLSGSASRTPSDAQSMAVHRQVRAQVVSDPLRGSTVARTSTSSRPSMDATALSRRAPRSESAGRHGMVSRSRPAGTVALSATTKSPKPRPPRPPVRGGPGGKMRRKFHSPLS